MNKNKEIKQDEILDDKNDLVGDEMLDKDEYIAKLNDDLNEQKKKTDEYFEHLKRNMAEFDNFKKRMNKEKDSMYYTITADLVSNLLPIIDNFEKALAAYAKFESEAAKGSKLEPVLVSAGPMENLRKAYPNLFLDISEFERVLMRLIKTGK